MGISPKIIHPSRRLMTQFALHHPRGWLEIIFTLYYGRGEEGRNSQALYIYIYTAKSTEIAIELASQHPITASSNINLLTTNNREYKS